MTRKTKYIQDLSSVGRKFATRRNDMCIAKDFKASYASDIEAFSVIRLNANNEMEIADMYSPTWDGVLHLASTLSAGKISNFISRGHTRYRAVAGVEAGEIKAANAGRITGFIRSITGGRTILAATAGEAGEITDTDAADETITVTSASDSDDGKFILVFGKQTTTGAAIMEYIECYGTTSNAGALVFDEVWGAIILDEDHLEGTPTACVGNITIINTTTETTLITIAATANNMGVNTVTSEYAFDRRVYADIDSIVAANTQLVGYDYTNAETIETLTHVATTGALKLISSNRWNRIVYEVCGGVADARTIAIAAQPNEDIVNGYVIGPNITSADAADKGGDAAITIESDDALDITQGVYIAKKNAAGTWAVVGPITLTGTTPVDISSNGDTVVGAYLTAATLGSITIKQDVNTVLVWDGAVSLGAGVLSPEGGDVAYAGLDLDARNGLVTFTLSNAAAVDFVCVQGEDIDGSAQVEGLTLSSGAATTSNIFSRITNVYCSGIASTEYMRIHNGTDDDPCLKIGKLLQPADAQDDIVEGIKY